MPVDNSIAPYGTVVADKFELPTAATAVGGDVRYRWATPNEAQRFAPLEANAIYKFVKLERANDKTIGAFAKRHVALEARRGDVMPDKESCERWRSVARVAAAYLRFAERIARGKLPDPSDRDVLRHWDQTIPWPEFNPRVPGLENADPKSGATWADTERLAEHVARMMRRGGVHVDFQWAMKSDAVLALRSLSLMGALFAQVAREISGGMAYAVCMECTLPYLPRRKPAAGRNNFCENCGTRASWKHSKRKQRTPLRERDSSRRTVVPDTRATSGH